MGTYTRFKCKVRLRIDIPNNIGAFLHNRVNEKGFMAFPAIHELFYCQHWENLFFAHHGGETPFFTGHGAGFILSLDADLKAYDDEINKFIDWIKPYAAIGHKPKTYIGWSKVEGFEARNHYIEQQIQAK